jgi:basic membrane lipoprotein Med (substrate-binding protein (PBP1-ABC) superfamily)
LSARRWWWVAGGAVVLVLAAVVLVLLTRSHGRQLPPPRARVYRDVSACLLTGPTGLSDPVANAVWAGMEDASTTTLARVSYLAVAGPETAANALPYAASLAQRRCNVIVAVGPAEVAAAVQEAGERADIRFVVIGAASGGSNVSVLAVRRPAELRPTVAAQVRTAVGG